MQDPLSSNEFAIIPTIVNGNQENVIIQLLETATELLKKAQTLTETQEIWQTVNALEALSKKFRLSKETQLDATELRIWVERQLGEFLNQENKQTKLSFTKNDLSKFQQLAKTPKDVFEAILTDLRTEATIKRKAALSTIGILRAIRDKQKNNNEPLFSSIIKPSDNWNFSSIQYTRIDDNFEKNRGYIPGEIYVNCFWYFVKPNDLVVAPMAGSGQVWRVYEARQEWMSQHIYDFELKMFDLTPRGKYQHLITQNDLTIVLPVNNPDYIIMDIPYYGMADQQYSSKSEDLANMPLEDWKMAMRMIAQNCSSVQKEGRLCTVISPNYRNITQKQIFMATAFIQSLWESYGYCLFDKAYSSRRIQQHQNPQMARMNNQAKNNRIMLTDITEIMTFTKL